MTPETTAEASEAIRYAKLAEYIARTIRSHGSSTNDYFVAKPEHGDGGEGPLCGYTFHEETRDPDNDGIFVPLAQLLTVAEILDTLRRPEHRGAHKL